jgi:type IV secretory pathway TraG/TraD family ATPase VirD4
MAEELYAALAGGVVLVLLALLWFAVHLGAWLNHLTAPAKNPARLVLDLLRRTTPWPPAATFVLVAEFGVVATLTAVGVWLVTHHHLRHEAVDVVARRLPRNAKALRRYSDPDYAPVAHEVGPGLAIGVDVVSGAVIRQSWEDVSAMIAGARTGKTTTQVAPAILAAPGAVYTCSNKRDVVDLTARSRMKDDAAVWIFDPQGIAEGQPTWWWNPLDMATNLADARNLAGLFAAASRPQGAQRDAYFDPEGEELLAILLLAARLSDEPLTTVYEWLSTGRNDRVVSRLAGGGHELAASALLDIMNQPDKQRAGVFGTARKDVSFLADPNLGDWITDRSDHRPRFDTDAFAKSHDTLYSLSKEGPGSAGPLTAALTAAVVLSAERLAARSVGGRLEVPMVCPLDDVANVCRWRELPDLYSHYGSRGIILMSFLQSWSQGVDVWGEHGMRKLWGAANIRLYGGGSNEQGFLHDIASVCGEMDTRQLTTSYNGGRAGQSRSYATRREPIFDVATLAALPRGRALLMASGIDPVLIRTQSVLDGPYAAAVSDSLASTTLFARIEAPADPDRKRAVPLVRKEPMHDDDGSRRRARCNQ